MTQLNSYLTFSLAGELYGVPLVRLREIIGGVEVVPVPYAPSDITGVVNFRGTILSVINLCQRFGLHSDFNSDENSTLVLETGDTLIGLQVDRVDSVVQIDDDQLEPPPPFSHHAMLAVTESVARLERQFIVILSTEKLFSYEERSVSDAGSFPVAVA